MAVNRHRKAKVCQCGKEFYMIDRGAKVCVECQQRIARNSGRAEPAPTARDIIRAWGR